MKSSDCVIPPHMKWMLPNCTIVLSMWFIIRSNSFAVWDISFILQKLLHSSMIPFPLNRGVSLLNLHEYGMADVRSLHPFSSLDIQSLVLFVFYHTSIGIRCDHMSYSTSSSKLLSDLPYGYRRYFSFSFSRVQ